MAVGIKITAEGRKSLIKLKRLQSDSETAIRKAFYYSGRDIRKDAQRKIIEGPKTGRLYRVPGLRRLHRASAPGEPPANRLKKLKNSIKFNVRGAFQLTIGAGGSSGAVISRSRSAEPVNYARPLELKLKRPYLRNTIDENARNIRTHILRELRKHTSR